MSSDYGYINARIRAMKSFLLREEDYLAVLRQHNLDEFISFLSGLASYTNDLRRILTTCETKFLSDEVLKLNLCRIFRKIINFSEGQPQRLIIILLTPFDLYNLKTIIRGIVSLRNKDEIIPALIPAGKWDIEFLSQLVKNKDLKALADCLFTSSNIDFEKDFAQLIIESQDAPLERLENNLQQLYFKKAQDCLNSQNINAKIVLDYLTLKIDFLNTLTVLNKAESQDKETPFISGGKLKKGFLKELLQIRSVEDTLRRFEQSPYTFLSKEGMDLYKYTQKLSSLERLLKSKLFSFCFSLYRQGDPLSVGIPLAFINFKENEIRNLRLINKAIYFGIPEDLVKKELIYA